MNNLIDYVKIYDNVLSESTCNNLIEAFNKNTVTSNPFYRKSSNQWNEDYRNF